MYAVNTYEQIERQERELNENHIIILLFVRPTSVGAQEIINEFSYLHHDSREYCSIYAVGYTDGPNEFGYSRKVEGVDGVAWYYSDKEFIDFKEKIGKRIKWRYSGENELIVLQSNIDGKNILNFQNYVAINISEGLRQEYICSYQNFMESLIESSKSEVEASTAINRATRLSIKKVAIESLRSIKRIPAPIEKVIENKIFYKTAHNHL